jgi:hypothetical protein
MVALRLVRRSLDEDGSLDGEEGTPVLFCLKPLTESIYPFALHLSPINQSTNPPINLPR